MDMSWVGLVTQIAGNAAGQIASSMDKDEAMRLIKASVDEYGKINVPKLQQLFLQQNGPSAFEKIHDDPQYRAQQAAADAQLNDVINSGGLTLADKAALNRIRNRTSRTASAGRHAIEQGMAARGTLDSGSQLAMELAGNQDAAQAAAEAGEQTAGAAQARLFAAIRERASQAGQGLDRSYRQQADAARAKDAIAAGNTAIANVGKMYNANLPQQDFNNQMALAGAKVGPTNALAGAHAAQAKDTQQQWNALGNIGAAAANKAGSSTANTGDFSGSNLNTPSPDGEGGFGSEPTDWNAYPGGSSDALSGASTKRQKELVGYDDEGKPIYGYRTNP
jgi:YD repeat-containing protein